MLHKTNSLGGTFKDVLGGLSIIIFLSSPSIAGYTTASAKNRANQILNSASVRAIVVSAQIQKGSETPTLGGFTDDAIGGATFESVVKNTAGTDDWNKATDKRFSLALTGLDEKVCTQMKTMLDQNSIIRNIADDCTTITYNNDLTATTFITDNKDSSSCESAGGAWDEATQTCGCPGRYTGSNCEIAPTSCPSGTTLTGDGRCQRCSNNGNCVVCEMEEEGKCAYAACTCYNPKTQNAECSDYNCEACEIKSDTPDIICSSYGGCICYNKNTQNIKCNGTLCKACDKDSATPDIICGGYDCICYNSKKQNVECNGSACAVCDKDSTTPDAICSSGYGNCICYNSKKQNVKCNYSNCQACNKDSTTPIARCEDEDYGECSCVAE